MKIGNEKFLVSNPLIYSPRQLLIFEKTKEKNRKAAVKDLAINELDYLEYPMHRTAIYYMSRVENPDYVVIYTYGGTIPHIFRYNENGEIVEACKLQFTWEWMEKWLSNNVAIAILDAPSYFQVNMSMPSSYRLTNDRMRECLHCIDRVAERFPNSKLAWHGLSYGTIEASRLSELDTKLEKIVLSSAPFHVLENWDEFHQGVRLDKYDVSKATVPVLIVQHVTEKFEKATEEMNKTDSITVTNRNTPADGHYFRRRQIRVVKAICDWIRGHEIQKEIP